MPRDGVAISRVVGWCDGRCDGRGDVARVVRGLVDVGNRLIAALDVPDRAEADALVARLDGVPSWVKIGLELFCAEGPGDRRATTRRAARGDARPQAARHPRDRRARDARGSPRSAPGCSPSTRAAGARCSRPRSTRARARHEGPRGHRADLARRRRPRRRSARKARSVELVVGARELAIAAGCDGVVASPHEVAAIRAIAPPRLPHRHARRAAGRAPRRAIRSA